jgi:ParB/RepB/Spo0J family partition protein
MESAIMIKEVDINSIRPHPKNIEIYGHEDVKDLTENIKKYGLLQPLIVTDKNIIISGHRRFQACKKLKYKTMPVTVKHYDSIEDEIEDLINLNNTREKTLEQKAREAAALVDVEKKKAEQRILSGKTINPTPELAGGVTKGEVRNIIADKVGFKSGHEAERAIKTIKKIDELKVKGDKEKAELLKNVLNTTSASTAEELSRYIDDMDEAEKEDIKTGKVTPYKYVTEAKKKRESKEKDWGELTELKKMADEYVAYSKSDIQLPLVESNIIIKGLKKAIASFNAAIAQVLSYERELNNLSNDEKTDIKNTLIDFEDQYFKNKSKIIKE